MRQLLNQVVVFFLWPVCIGVNTFLTHIRYILWYFPDRHEVTASIPVNSTNKKPEIAGFLLFLPSFFNKKLNFFKKNIKYM